MASVSIHDSRRTTHVTVKAVTLLLGVLTIVLLISTFFSDRAMPELQNARQRVAALRADIRRLDAENARLRSEIDSVRRSTYAVERIAREDLGMSKKGEVVYMLPHK